MAKRIIKSDKKANAGKAGAKKVQKGLVEKSVASGKMEKKNAVAGKKSAGDKASTATRVKGMANATRKPDKKTASVAKKSAKASPASDVAVKSVIRSEKNSSVQKTVAAGNSEKKNSSGLNKSAKTTGKKIPASGVPGKLVSTKTQENSDQKHVANGKVQPKKSSSAINAKPAKKSSTSVASSKSSIIKAGLNNSSLASSSNKSSLRDPFSEKLNTVTPSGYKDQTFFEQVFDVARQIPKGRVTSYGAIAASLGARSSSRMVGWAMNLAGSAKPRVPAHRVVNRNGMLSGKHHFATPTQMQELLEKEGIAVKDDKVVNFSKLFWDPMDL